jgi:hypothetical protein
MFETEEMKNRRTRNIENLLNDSFPEVRVLNEVIEVLANTREVLGEVLRRKKRCNSELSLSRKQKP